MCWDKNRNQKVPEHFPRITWAECFIYMTWHYTFKKEKRIYKQKQVPEAGILFFLPTTRLWFHFKIRFQTVGFRHESFNLLEGRVLLLGLQNQCVLDVTCQRLGFLPYTPFTQNSVQTKRICCVFHTNNKKLINLGRFSFQNQIGGLSKERLFAAAFLVDSFKLGQQTTYPQFFLVCDRSYLLV